MKLHERIWTQVDGDMAPGSYGGTIARRDGDAIELRKIQPVREYVGNDEACEVGYPFWTREAYYAVADLDPSKPDVASAMESAGLDDETMADMDESTRPIAIACACLDYGHCAEEGPAGWARDILGTDRVRWNAPTWGRDRKTGEYRHMRSVARGWRFLADEDAEFRRMLRERNGR